MAILGIAYRKSPIMGPSPANNSLWLTISFRAVFPTIAICSVAKYFEKFSKSF